MRVERQPGGLLCVPSAAGASRQAGVGQASGRHPSGTSQCHVFRPLLTSMLCRTLMVLSRLLLPTLKCTAEPCASTTFWRPWRLTVLGRILKLGMPW